MNNELITTKALEGEYIAAGEEWDDNRPQQKTSFDLHNEAMESQQRAAYGARAQQNAFAQQQGAFGGGLFGQGLGGAFGGLFR
jgi:hypothetical protein